MKRLEVREACPIEGCEWSGAVLVSDEQEGECPDHLRAAHPDLVNDPETALRTGSLYTRPIYRRYIKVIE